MTQRWTCSQYISWFQQRDTLYAYHDLFGYILAMSPDIQTLWASFLTPQHIPEIPTDDTAASHLKILCEHDFLIPEHTDELSLLLDRFPIRGPWIVTYDDPTHGVLSVIGRNPETPAELLPLTPPQTAVWRALDGLLTTAEISVKLGLDPQEVAAWIAVWTHSELQLTRIDRVSARFYEHQHVPRPPYLSSTMPFKRLDNLIAPHPHSPQQTQNKNTRETIDLRAYHQHTIHNAQLQFDEVETTLSHLFRRAHIALQNKTYAASLLDALTQQNFLRIHPTDLTQIKEIGGGIGAFAQGFLLALQSRFPNDFENIRYCILDVSPELNRSQKEHLNQFPLQADAQLADAETLSLPNNSVDLLISNEVIGDLRTTFLRWESDPQTTSPQPEDEEAPPWFDPDAPPPDSDDAPPATLHGDAETIATLARLHIDISDAPAGEFAINLGPLLLIERLQKWLKPGGCAILTEFGDLWRYPVESTHLDHAEFSIHFGHLLQAARSVGLHAEVVDVFDLLNFDGRVEVLASTRTYQRNLGVLLASRGVKLEKIAYTRDMFETLLLEAKLNPARLQKLQFQPLEERVMGLVPREFKALLLRKN